MLGRYRKLGLEWGVFCGAVLGIVAGGLQMHRWESPFTGWAITTAVLAALGGAAGYFFYDLLFGSQIRAGIDGGGWADAGSGAGADGDGG